MVRTALFNWAYARHTGGTFVFRIEDTDAARDSEESYRQLLDALRWLGLDWDEGVEKGGPYGPYRQSERLDIYADVARRLVEGGFAYESYSTPQEIEARHRAAGRSPQLGYDGFDRDLTLEQRAAYRAEGRLPVLRVRVPDQDVTFDDLVRGPVTFKAGSVPDFAIVRGNGDPLYTLTNPVDDALMRITHVLRGEDLLSSTPRQVVLYRALEAIGVAEGIPQFGHLPYVMGEGNKKLSKRDPQSNLFHHRDRGFLPEGLVNYLALLGWSIAPDRDVFSAAELVKAFDVRDVNPNPARFDLKKAEAINASQIRLLPEGELARRVVPYLHTAGLVSGSGWVDLGAREQELLLAAAPLVQERITLLSEAVGMLGFFFMPDAAVAVEPEALARLGEGWQEVLTAALDALESDGGGDGVTGSGAESGIEAGADGSEAGWTAGWLHDVLNAALVDGLGIKPRHAFTPLRVAITGRRVSPPLFESMEVLGRASSVARIRRLASGQYIA
jgi:glutamyl-tRNA synthetase